MNKDLEKLISDNITSYDSWTRLLPEGQHFVWSFIIDSIRYRLHRFDPKITNLPSEFSLYILSVPISKGSSGSLKCILSGDESKVIDFFKPLIRESKLNEMLD